MKPIFNFIPQSDDFIKQSADFIAAGAEESANRHGLFTIALSGGSTPRPIYEMLAEPPYRETFPWRRTHFFWGDERCVGPDHKDSNFRMAYEALLSKAPVPEENIHRLQAEWRPPALAVEQYERELQAIFSDATNRGIPSFDLILLGMGEDGHTASLFPDSPNLRERSAWVVTEQHPGLSPKVPRITFTFPLINAARKILFVVAQDKKAETLNFIVRRPEDAAKKYPAAMVRPAGDLIWNIRGSKPAPKA